MTLAYLDTSALVKLVVAETETAALRAWLADGPTPVVVTSALTRVELTRAATRRGAVVRARVADVLDATSLVAVSGEVLAAAATLEPASPRSLDAIHLATAVRVGSSLTAFVAYDGRLLDAARRLDLPVVVPR